MNTVSLLAVLVAASLLLPSAAAWSSRTAAGSSLIGRPRITARRRTSVSSQAPLVKSYSQRRNPLVLSVQATRAVDIENQTSHLVSDSFVMAGDTSTGIIDEASAAALEMSISTNNADAIMDAETKDLAQKIVNAVFLAVCFGWAAYTIFNIDDGMTRGWTQGEIAMRIPLDNWSNYERSLQDKPIFTKTLINVVIYLLGDWLSQTVFQKKNVLDFDVSRTL